MKPHDSLTSKLHTFQDHHGDVPSPSRRHRSSPARAMRFLFLGFFQTVPPPFSVSLFLSSFLSFWDRQVFMSHFSFCLCSCTGISVLYWLASRFPSLFSLFSIYHPLRKIHIHDECWLHGDLFVTCTVWQNESATLTQLCQNTNVWRL